MNTTHRSRIVAIDLLRGLVMLLMLVDHVRETIYLHLQVSDPMAVDSTAPELFFTRMCAHLCAPTFVFLTGLSAWLYAHPPGRPERSASGFLFKRGLLLVVLEWTLVSFAWTGTLSPTRIYLQVIWVIGLSMMVLALFVRLPRIAIAVTGFVIVFGHNLLTGIHFQPGDPGYMPWTILYEKGYLIAPGGPFMIKVSYPLLPWIGVILLGYFAGPLYGTAVSSAQRVRWLIQLGIASLAVLLVLRGFNIYGETLPWVAGQDPVHTLMSFVNYTKYPPSLDFLLLTLGLAFLLLAAFEHANNALARVVTLYGGAPMFFYLLHLYTLLILQNLAVAIFGANHGERFGVERVLWIWVVAAVLAIVLYFPVSAFARYKQRSTQAWVRYF
ncbi:MAG: heparan-alpha-glucosaminide N-acetyltransferase domain-containing protein [Steroidobacteraceae bacterium]